MTDIKITYIPTLKFVILRNNNFISTNHSLFKAEFNSYETFCTIKSISAYIIHGADAVHFVMLLLREWPWYMIAYTQYLLDGIIHLYQRPNLNVIL